MEELKQKLCALAAALLLVYAVGAPALALDDDESDAYAADTLIVKVGYFGGPYYEKAVFTLDELQAMDSVVQMEYTFIDNMPAVGIAHVVGIRLSDLMDAAGIDLNSIQSFNFKTRDGVGGDVYRTKSFLIDMPRYCYYSLPDNYDDEQQMVNEYAGSYAEPVETVIAWAEDWRRCIEGASFGSDYENLDEKWRFRLVYGQTAPEEITASESYYWIYEIVVQLGGAPVLTLDASVLEGEVGSVLRTEAGVSADSTVLENESITWSSNDESVATVDETGNITIHGAGTAVITAAFGGVTASVTVNGTPGEETGDSLDPGEPGESGESGEADSPPKSEEPQPPDTAEPAQPQTVTPSETEQTEADPQLLTPVTIAESEAGGVQNWRKDEMSETATALPNIEPDGSALRTLGISAGCLFAVSGVVYAAAFYQNIGRKRK